MDSDNLNLTYLIILLVLVGSSLIAHFAYKPLKFLKYSATWISLFFMIILIYSYRHDLHGRISAELFTATPVHNQDGSISFRASNNGHYNIMTTINNKKIIFMLDTGASDVVLTPQDAENIGINLQDLQFNKVYNTANGTVYGAPITIKTMRIGNITLRNIPASVNQVPMTRSLLGMSLLNRFSSYEVHNGILTIKH